MGGNKCRHVTVNQILQSIASRDDIGRGTFRQMAIQYHCFSSSIFFFHTYKFRNETEDNKFIGLKSFSLELTLLQKKKVNLVKNKMVFTFYNFKINQTFLHLSTGL